MPTSLDPVHVFRFQVAFRPVGGGADQALVSGAFSEVTGLEATMEPVAVSEGGRNWGQAQLPGRTTFSTVILRRGISPTRHLWEWFRHVNQRQGAYAHRMDVTITLQDAAGEPLLSWTLGRALPVKLKVPDLAAAGQELGIEELHLVFDDLTEAPAGSAG
ncbi:MAG: phage tail protein [Myxococcota bacterium]